MIENNISTTPPTQIETQAKQQQEYKMIGQMRLRRGLKLYAFYPQEGVIKEPDVTGEAGINLDGTVFKKLKTTFDHRAIYFQALNMKNAERKAQKMLKQIILMNYAKFQRDKAKEGKSDVIEGHSRGEES